MTRQIPINPAILSWARQTAGVSVEEAARRIGGKRITAKVVAGWERGEGSPTYVQLETLAYKVYKRPLALFFFPEPPMEDTPAQAFRTLPPQQIQRISPRLRYLVRQAQTMQLNLAELFDGVNPAQRQVVRDLRAGPDASPDEIASAVRTYLDVPLASQMQWNSAETAFRKWRNALEECGVFVFKEAFKDDAISGFCLLDEHFPIIYVNNSKPHTRQVFTLFHELAHLLSGTGGIDAPIETYIAFLRGDARRVEILCNSFAGAFLVPDEDFDRRIRTISISEESIEDLAGQYCVSREVILRKLLDRRMVSRETYDLNVEQWRKKAKGRSDQKGDYYRTKGAYLGVRYLELVFSRLYQNRISVEQLADYLGVKIGHVPRMEALLFEKAGRQ